MTRLGPGQEVLDHCEASGSAGIINGDRSLGRGSHRRNARSCETDHAGSSPQFLVRDQHGKRSFPGYDKGRPRVWVDGLEPRPRERPGNFATQFATELGSTRWDENGQGVISGPEKPDNLWRFGMFRYAPGRPASNFKTGAGNRGVCPFRIGFAHQIDSPRLRASYPLKRCRLGMKLTAQPGSG
jgi:hypothetical protein